MVAYQKFLLVLALPIFLTAVPAQAAATRSAQASPETPTSDGACVPKVDAKGRQVVTGWQRRNCPDLARAEQNVPRKSNFFAVPGLILGAAAAGGGVAAGTSGSGGSSDSPGG